MNQDVEKRMGARISLAKVLAGLFLSILCVTAYPLDARADESTAVENDGHSAFVLDAAGVSAEADVSKSDPSFECPPAGDSSVAQQQDESQDGNQAEGALAPLSPEECNLPKQGDLPEGNDVSAGSASPEGDDSSNEADASELDLHEASAPADEPTTQTSAFAYQHDPRDNPKAMKDIVADAAAVYGFRPSPDGSLKQYAGADWHDQAVVEMGRQTRIAYHESLSELYDILAEMQKAGATEEEIARAVSTRRNEIRMASCADDPEGLAALKARNLEEYGNENGGTPEFFYNRYGSWETVIEKSFNVNSGMDACLGLYDIYYDLYVAAGQVPADAAEPEPEPADAAEPEQESIDAGEQEQVPAEVIEPEQEGGGSIIDKGAAETTQQAEAAPSVTAMPVAASSATSPSTLPATGDDSPAPLLVVLLAGASLVAAGSHRRMRGEDQAA